MQETGKAIEDQCPIFIQTALINPRILGQRFGELIIGRATDMPWRTVESLESDFAKAKPNTSPMQLVKIGMENLKEYGASLDVESIAPQLPTLLCVAAVDALLSSLNQGP